jgi:phosphonate transport system substrate-binding protein
MKRLLSLAVLAGLAAIPAAHAQSAAPAADCPNGGTVRFGVEPYETAARLVPIYNHIGDLIGKKIG